MVDVGAPARVQVPSSVDWAAIFAGAVAASAISFVLLTAGGSIGLSLVSAEPAQSYGKLAASLAAFWMIFIPILSLLIGGYIAGRLRLAPEQATEDEVTFRDGIQGLLVWAVSVVLGGILAFLTAASVAHLGAGVTQDALSGRATLVASAVDHLLRPPAPQPQVTEAPATPAPAPANATTAREPLARALTTAIADGQLTAEDRAYLTRAVAAETGLSQADAEKRVDEIYATALKAAETARKAAVAAGLVAATALLLGLAAAWYAAQRGGRHRDQNIPAKFRLTGRGCGMRPNLPVRSRGDFHAARFDAVASWRADYRHHRAAPVGHSPLSARAAHPIRDNPRKEARAGDVGV